MSFRAKLSVVMAFVVFAPLLTAGLVLWSRVPRLQAARAASVAEQSAAAAALTLVGLCIGVNDTARGLSQTVASSATANGPDVSAVSRATEEAAGAHVGMSIVVLDASGEAITVGGPVSSATAATEAAANAPGSCSQGRSPQSAALAESVPVRIRQDDGSTRMIATVVAWVPVNDTTVNQIASALALPENTQLAVTSVVTGELVAASDRAAVADHLGRGVAGEPDGQIAVHERPATPTGFYAVAVTWPGSVVPLASLLPAFALAVAGLLLALVVVSRITRPLVHVAHVAQRLGREPTARTGMAGKDEFGLLGSSFDAMADELQAKTEELERQIEVQRQAGQLLEETFAQFGEALGSTHNLHALLEAVLAAGVEGTGARLGSIHVIDHGELQQMAVAPRQERGRPDIQASLADLRDLAAECLVTGAEVTMPGIDGAGVGLAVPLRTRQATIGVIAVARGRGVTDFERPARDRLVSLAKNAGTAIANVRDHEENRRLSVTDALTGTGNLRKLTATLDREVERSTRFGRVLSVLMLDLDHFKQVNDTLGHEFGDGVLRQFAQRLEGCLRDVDTVARYGGEEFAVILPETDTEGAEHVAERIVSAVRSAPFVVGDQSRRVTVSVGVAQFPVDGRTSSEVMRAADAALYNAKRSGRDCWRSASAAEPLEHADPVQHVDPVQHADPVQPPGSAEAVEAADLRIAEVAELPDADLRVADVTPDPTATT